MKVKYINPFITATQFVFKTMLFIDVKLSKPIFKTEKKTSGDVTGIMGLVGDKKGTITISFSREGAMFVYQSLFSDECSSVTPDVIDAIGELTNIISGQSRKELEKVGINLKASIPMVVVGRDVEMNFITTLPIVQLPFSFKLKNGAKETMYLGISFE